MISIYDSDCFTKLNFTYSKFPDGTFHIKMDLPDDYEGGEVNIEWKYENEEEMILLFYLVSYIKEHFNSDIYLDLPYIPNARMDRVEDDKTVFTLKYFCNFINSLNFTAVGVRDPHSDVSIALLDRVVVRYGKDDVNENIDNINDSDILYKENSRIDMLFFPDEGAMKRYSKKCTIPFAYGQKIRNWQTGEILDYTVVNPNQCDIEGKNILIVDDISSYGGTFYHAAKKLKDTYGANKVWLYVTHCENNILNGKLPDSGYVDHVFTSNSIFTKENETDFVTII